MTFKLDDVGAWHEVAAKAATTVAEANIISILTSGDLQTAGKKKKVDAQITKLTNWGVAFGVDLQAKMHKRVHAEAMALPFEGVESCIDLCHRCLALSHAMAVIIAYTVE